MDTFESWLLEVQFEMEFSGNRMLTFRERDKAREAWRLGFSPADFISTISPVQQ